MEVVACAFAQLVDDEVTAGAVRVLGDGDVRGDSHQVRGHGGHVQVVHVEDAVNVQHVGPQLGDVHGRGRLLHEDREGAPQEGKRARTRSRRC